MSEIILRNAIVADQWQVLRPEAGAVAEVPAGRVIVPLTVWTEQADALLARGDVAVWLGPADDPAALEPWIDRLPLVAVDFPKFTDGRGFSIAYLLRARYGYKGELRAIGDVLPDQIFYMKRVGFDAFALRADKDIRKTLAMLDTFSETYQGSWDQPVPAFRRVARGQAPEART